MTPHNQAMQQIAETITRGSVILMVDDSYVEFVQKRFGNRPLSKTDDKRGPEAVTRFSNAKETGGYGYAVDSSGVAVVKISGVITPENWAWYDNEETITDWVVRDLNAMGRDDRVRAVLFAINSPGGYVAGAFEMSDAIERISAAKPTATFAGAHCCSAAYLQAVKTAHITVYKTSIVGSIGTRSLVIDAHGFLSGLGIKVIPIDSGGMKSVGLLGTEIKPEQIEYLRGTVKGLQTQFTESVATGRRVSVDKAGGWADGRVHVAAAAKEIGLIDRVGSMETAMSELLARVKPAASSAARFNVEQQQPAADPAAGDHKEHSAEGGDADVAEGFSFRPTSQGAAANSSGGDSMSQTNNGTAPAQGKAEQPGEPKPASIAELKAAFPNDSAFALDCAEQALTLTEAKAKYADVLAERNAKLQKENTDLKQGGKPVGTKGLSDTRAKPGTETAAADDGGAIAEYEDRIAQKMKANPKLERHDAAAAVFREDEDLRVRYNEERLAQRDERIEQRVRDTVQRRR